MSNATIRRDVALEELLKVAVKLEQAEATGIQMANGAADRSELAGRVRELFVREYVASHVRAELMFTADMVRHCIERLTPRRPGKR